MEPYRIGALPEASCYTCLRVNVDLPVNGRLDHPVWKKAPRSSRFVDMVSGVPGFFDTRMAALWNERTLYIGFWIAESDIRAQITRRDDFVYRENDVEVFIEGRDCYYEFQINALGTVYEVFYIWQDAYTPSSRFNCPEFDLLKREVDVLGGFQDSTRFGKHPRGRRWAIMDWDFPGLKSAVTVDGTLNDPATVDKEWRVELAFPWKGMRVLDPERKLPPRPGDIWRMDFSRFERLEFNGVTADPHPGWSHSPHGVYDSHLPEAFSRVFFSDQLV